MRRFVSIIALFAFVVCATVTRAQQPFRELVGDVRVGSVATNGAVQTPFITWGGDVATFHANGGLNTRDGSIYDRLGLDLAMVNGDDFPAQVRRYMTGESPYLRGTLRMLGQASEVLGSDPRTKPVVFMQLTWSAGDHVVSRGGLAQIDDLKGKRIAVQQGGPHVGMLDDVLRAAQLDWSDIDVVWCEALTGAGSPAERFRADATIDACAVITPDMLGLIGGLDQQGTGAEGTVRDARVLVSTATMSRSIADVYAVRKDYFDANRDKVMRFAAGYLKATEELVPLRNDFESGTRSDTYTQALQMAQDILGEDVLPTLEVDAHGLLLDATFVGLPGNRAFFEDAGNLSGFERKSSAALDLATGLGYAGIRAGFLGPKFDWAEVAGLGGVTKTEAVDTARFSGEAVDLFPDDVGLSENTLLSFTISFDADQIEFPLDVYGPEFLRAIETASTFGNAVIAIRGHADPTLTLRNFVRTALDKGVLKRQGTSGNYRYYYDGRPLDLESTRSVIEIIEAGGLAGGPDDPLRTLQAARNLSRKRASAVRDAVLAYARANGLSVDASQIQPIGVGVTEPVVAKPTNNVEAAANRRVEFAVVRVSAELLTPSEFDF